MKDMVNQMVSGTFRSLMRRFETKDADHGGAARVKSELEWIVEMVDPAIRCVPRYKKKLYDAIATSLEFADHVVAEIPGAIDVRRANFVSDPYVNAFFVNAQDLQMVFNRSSEIREFLDDCGNQAAGCYALLCMRKTEKTVFGVELEGDMLRHDVQQTAVNFSDHRIYSPCPTEAECRNGLKHCLVQGLGTHTLERIMRLKLSNHRLQQERHDLNMRLRRLGSRGETDTAVAREADAISRKLGQVEQQSLNSRLAGPEESLREVQNVFSSPDDYMRIQKTTLLLNWMCIKVDKHSEQPRNTVNLTEVSIGEDAPRVVTLVKFAGEELLPAEEFRVPGYFS
jgi:hypothetical protein